MSAVRTACSYLAKVYDYYSKSTHPPFKALVNYSYDVMKRISVVINYCYQPPHVINPTEI